MARRGFFAEMEYQAQQRAKRQRMEEQRALRAHQAAVREHERALRAAERAAIAEARASEAERKALERERARLHTEARLAEVAKLNAALAEVYESLDGILAWTLDYDDYVDLASLKQEAVHPAFDARGMDVPAPMPDLVLLDLPVYLEPPAPTGLGAAFGGAKKHAVAVQDYRAQHASQVVETDAENQRRRGIYEKSLRDRERSEQERMRRLEELRAIHSDSCAQREEDVARINEDLDRLINELAFDVPSAIEEYVEIVLASSAYPEAFPVSHALAFDLSARELRVNVSVPTPDCIPSVKEFKYVKARDEITQVDLPAKARRERYDSAVYQVAVRTLHEVFEADRQGKIKLVALTVGANRPSPSTGLIEFAPLVRVAADRDAFAVYDLAQVVPRATLEHLGASLSRSPYDGVALSDDRAVRRQGA